MANSDSARKSRQELKSRIRRSYRKSDPHVEMYRKEYHEVRFSASACPMCGSKVDELGMCACGAGDS